MKIVYIMEVVITILLVVLCGILAFKLLYRLRSALPWRVNCWFCNNDFWIKFLNRNCWTCPKCEQYNGFTKDGDYNKPITSAAEQTFTAPRVFQKSPPKNGLCKMCNINQQLKVAQLSGFVAINENNYDQEIETYKTAAVLEMCGCGTAHGQLFYFHGCERGVMHTRDYKTQLEKAYKLCSPCKRVLQIKLHKEKETLLATKLLETRAVNNRVQPKNKHNQILKNFLDKISTYIAGILIVTVSIELYSYIEKDNNLPDTITNANQIMVGLLERIASIVKMKTLLTFPSLENYLVDLNLLFNKWPKTLRINDVTSFMILTQKALGGFVCFIQIVGHIWNVHKLKHTIGIDLLWTVFVLTSMTQTATIDPLVMTLIKLASASIVFILYKSLNSKPVKSNRLYATPKRMKNLMNGSTSSLIDDEDTLSFDTDDDVSLSKFGLHNFTDSSNETIGPMNNSLINGRTFTPRSDSVWSKPKHNSTFCVNSVISKSPSSVSETVFAKPSFHKYQKLVKDDSDSDLDESISSLCIGSPKKPKKTNPIFSLRKFNATPTFVTPTPMTRARPLISPSKLGHSTSWVAGGYWGSEGERQVFNINGSRSSSQSSGFESQASSMNQRNVFSQPSSREESVCGEPMVIDNCHMPNYNSFQSPQNFSRVNSPVFPQMQYNGHVHIPQPRFAQQGASLGPSVFAQQQYVQNSMFKTPGGSGLIKLPLK